MSVNDINILRIAFYTISIFVILSSFIFAIIKLSNSQKIFLEIILVSVFLLFGLLTAFSTVFDVFKFNVDENTEQVIKSIYSGNINTDMFEPCDDMADKKIKMVANDDVVVYFTLQPVNTVIYTGKETDFLNDIQEKIYKKR